MATLCAALILSFAHPMTSRSAEQAGVYDVQMERLAEVLGSIHYLRNLCGEKSNQWREQMDHLLDVERPSATRRARLVARFNKGYRSFASVYYECTDRARTIVSRYMAEGQALTDDMVTRYAD